MIENIEIELDAPEEHCRKILGALYREIQEKVQFYPWELHSERILRDFLFRSLHHLGFKEARIALKMDGVILKISIHSGPVVEGLEEEFFKRCPSPNRVIEYH